MTTDTPTPVPLAEVLRGEPTPQRPFPWNAAKWTNEMHDFSEVLAVLDRLPERVDRETTLDVVQAELAGSAAIPALVAAMVWGYGTTGYGPTRVRWILTGSRSGTIDHRFVSSVGDRLLSAARTVRADGPEAAYRLMNNDGRIKFLGAAFFTKWLYFASAVDGPDDPDAAPILDKQVAGWIQREAGVHLNVNRSDSYASYLDLLAAWGGEHGRSRVQVEKAIFTLATGRG
jgi:hypothetical protein